MSEDPTRESGPSAADEPPPSGAEDEAMRQLLKRSLAAPSEAKTPDLVSGVQRKLRRRSRGKFYADGWSTTSARGMYILVAIAMLLVLAVAYLVLGPVGVSVR